MVRFSATLQVCLEYLKIRKERMHPSARLLMYLISTWRIADHNTVEMLFRTALGCFPANFKIIMQLWTQLDEMSWCIATIHWRIKYFSSGIAEDNLGMVDN
jgi:hypothetical protein